MTKKTQTLRSPHVPGPLETAAVREYFERGSKFAVSNLGLNKMVIMLMLSNLILAAALVSLLPLKTVEIVKVTQDKNDRIRVLDDQISSSAKFIADESAQLAWVSDWAQDVFEINAATWQRNLKRGLSRTSGAAKDQLQDYWRIETNNPAALLSKDRDYVRELERVSINAIQPNVILIRYKLISRLGDGTKSVKSLATTVTLKNSTPKSRDEIIDNPTGLLAQSVSMSEESK